jgi:hypothetical protein
VGKKSTGLFRVALGMAGVSTVLFAVTCVLFARNVAGEVLLYLVGGTLLSILVTVQLGNMAINQKDRIEGGFLGFATWFNVPFAFVPVAGPFICLWASQKLFRGIIAGGTITSGASSVSRDDTRVGRVSIPSGIAILLMALVQPAFVVLGAQGVASADSATEIAAPPPSKQRVVKEPAIAAPRETAKELVPGAPSEAPNPCQELSAEKCTVKAKATLKEGNLEGAKALYKGACAMGHKPACATLADLLN